MVFFFLFVINAVTLGWLSENYKSVIRFIRESWYDAHGEKDRFGIVGLANRFRRATESTGNSGSKDTLCGWRRYGACPQLDVQD